VQRNPETYEHIEPELVGNSRKILISELAGGSNLKAKLANRYPELEDNRIVKSILDEIQDREHAGYSFENADGSFDLVVRRHVGKYKTQFEPLYYRIYSPSNEDHSESDGLIEASVKVRVGTADDAKSDNLRLCAAVGNGPVDALNRALRKALLDEFPVLEDLHLTDFTVRVVNSTEETAAKVRVYLEHRFQGEMFGTVGVNVDIIKASWNALVEAYHYALMQHVEFKRELEEAHSEEERKKQG
jgi:2-isopropylmalate synthase